MYWLFLRGFLETKQNCRVVFLNAEIERKRHRKGVKVGWKRTQTKVSRNIPVMALCDRINLKHEIKTKFLNWRSIKILKVTNKSKSLLTKLKAQF